MDYALSFIEDYATARSAFINAAKKKSALIQTYQHPLTGPQGEALATDVAILGNPQASNFLFITSATHGIEGFYGSSIQTGWLNSLKEPCEQDLTVVLIHAINPHGFAHCRRVTENNVDLNRNFIDFASLPAKNQAYAELLSNIIPKDWHGEKLEASNNFLDLVKKTEPTKYFHALYSGQYFDPQGMSFGGLQPTWSNKTLWNILDSVYPQKKVAWIDLHTGYGDYLNIDIYSSTANDPHHKRVMDWYQSLANVVSLPYPLTGCLINAVIQHYKTLEVTGMVIECGTLPLPLQPINNIRAEHWLYQYGDLTSELAKKIKQDFKNTFYPQQLEWREHVWHNTMAIINQAINRLRG